MEQAVTRRNVLVVATVLGLIAAILVFTYIRRAAPTTATVPVVLATQDIAPRTIIEPQMVETRNVQTAVQGAVASDQEVIGKVALMPMQREHIIMPGEVQEKSVALGLAYTVPPGMRAVTVALDPIIGVAGFLKPGDHVDVVATFNINDGTVTKTVLQNLELLATGSQVYKNMVDTSDNAEKAKEAPHATLAVDPRDAERLILAESKGKLRLALRGVGDVVHIPTAGITSRSLIGSVPPDVPQQVAKASSPAPAPRYIDRAPMLPAGWENRPVPGAVVLPPPGPEVEVIKGTQVERIPVKT